jgi:thioredoxin-related protein
MKKILFFLFFTISLYAEITDNWYHDINKAKKEAQKQKKDIYVFVGANKCHFCKMYKKVLKENPSTLKELKKHFILVYLSRDEHKIPDNFQKFGVPLHYFLKPNGEIYFLDAGTKNKEGIILMIDEAELNR